MTDREKELEEKVEKLEKQVEDLQKLTEDTLLEMGQMSISQRLLQADVHLLEFLKSADFIFDLNMLKAVGAKDDAYRQNLNSALGQWKLHTMMSHLGDSDMPKELKRLIISHIEEAQTMCRGEFMGLRQQLNDEIDKRNKGKRGW